MHAIISEHLGESSEGWQSRGTDPKVWSQFRGSFTRRGEVDVSCV